jgi:hypothetical protein
LYITAHERTWRYGDTRRANVPDYSPAFLHGDRFDADKVPSDTAANDYAPTCNTSAHHAMNADDDGT